MAKIPVSIETWEYDDQTFVLTAVFVDQPRADNPDPVNFKPTVRVVANIPLPVAAVLTKPSTPRPRI